MLHVPPTLCPTRCSSHLRKARAYVAVHGLARRRDADAPDQTPRGRDATVALDQRDCRVHPDRLGARHLERPPPALLERIWREFRSRLADAAALAGLEIGRAHV